METNRKSNNWLTVGLLISVILYLYPLFMTVMNSFKTYGEMFDSYISLPSKLNFDNYSTALESLDYAKSLKNSVLLTGITVIGILITASLAGYKLSRVNSKFNRFMYTLFILPYLIPFFAYMIPVVQMANYFNLNNSIIGVSLINIGTSGAFALLMFHGFVKSVPKELDEAGYIDGCSELDVFFRIIVPLMKPVISTVAIVYSLWIWNEFLIPFLLLSDDNSNTLIIKMYELFGTYGSKWDIILASMVFISLPIVVLYMLFQRQIISGISAGAVKG
ncbi:carbohydrate ABC transporter permease [Paenibacillus sp. NPDC058174]|uniref:carbohydrate ABC transporter permease n=1 Tax=Paenibacillus sp. NPDC058174 TaxID=3346366 RepID=UPI0036D7C840